MANTDRSALPTPAVAAATAADIVLCTLLADSTRFADGETVDRILSNVSACGSSSTSLTSCARQTRKIIAIWDGRAFRYPMFQFDTNGGVLGRLRELIDVLPPDADGSNRSAALWLFSVDGALGGRSPAEVFPSDPDRVIALRKARLNALTASE